MYASELNMYIRYVCGPYTGQRWRPTASGGLANGMWIGCPPPCPMTKSLHLQAALAVIGSVGRACSDDDMEELVQCVASLVEKVCHIG